MATRWLGLASAALLFFYVQAVPAEEPVTIGAILASPETYYSRTVTLQGTARQVTPAGMIRGRCGPVYDSYSFTLEDGTGSIVVDVAGTCRGPGVVLVVNDGDKVLVEAVIAEYTGGDRPLTIRASARELRRVGN